MAWIKSIKQNRFDRPAVETFGHIKSLLLTTPWCCRESSPAMSSGEPTSAIEFKGANHQSMLKSFSSLPAFDLVIVIEAPENKNEVAPNVRRTVAVMMHMFFAKEFKRSAIKS